MVNGQVVSDASVPRLTWNESFVGRLGNLVDNIADRMVEKIRVQLEAGLQARLHALVGEKMEGLLQSVPGAKIAREHVSIELLPDQVVLTIRYEKAAFANLGHAGRFVDVASREVAAGKLHEAVGSATRKCGTTATRSASKVARPMAKRVTSCVKLPRSGHRPVRRHAHARPWRRTAREGSSGRANQSRR